MTKRDGDEWVIETEASEDPPRLAPRFYNIAVKRLGYTHTEAGHARLGQIADELSDLAAMEREAREDAGDLSWIKNREVL